jgi:hypothetical protein
MAESGFISTPAQMSLTVTRQGIRIPGHALRNLLARRWAAFRAGMIAVEVSGERVAPTVLRDTDWTRREVLLVVCESQRDSTT